MKHKTLEDTEKKKKTTHILLYTLKYVYRKNETKKELKVLIFFFIHTILEHLKICLTEQNDKSCTLATVLAAEAEQEKEM